MSGKILKAAAREGKHIICKKPMVITSEKIEDVIKVDGRTVIKKGTKVWDTFTR